MNEDRRLAIIGLGYVGLPLAISFVEAGLEVEGVDAQPSRVAELSAGRSPIDDIPDARLSGAIAAGLRVVGHRRRRGSPRRTSSSSASRPRSTRPRTRISGRSSRPPS